MVCYESDASRIAGRAERVLFPESIEEVQKIIKNTNIDIVPRGAGSGLAGGAVPNGSAVVDMSKMNKVSNFLPLRKTVRAEAGVTIKELNEKLNALGFEFPIDPSNKGVSSIGGMIATNASGDRSMRYGTIKEWIEEIEFVNGRGELMKTSKADLTDICGMEGITGIIVAATLKLSYLIKRSASAFQSDDLNEILSTARKLKSEKEVVILELFSPMVSELLGLPKKYNLIIEFNSERGKIKREEYEEIAKLRENLYNNLASYGYYNSEDPKFFFDKLKEFILFLEENEIPYIGHLGAGIIHPFFKDSEKSKRDMTIEYIKKMKALPGKYGIGTIRKYFLEGFQLKLIERVKIRHDPFFKFNRGKIIDSEHGKRKLKVEKENKPAEKMDMEIEEYDEEREEESFRGKDGIESKEIPAPLGGEEISASEIIQELRAEGEELSPEERMEEFIREAELVEKIRVREELSEKEDLEKSEMFLLDEKKKTISERDIDYNEIPDAEVRARLKDYENTFKSELKNDKMHEVEEIARNIPKDIIKKEKIKMDYKQIQDIMTNKFDKKEENEEEIRIGKVKVSDNFERRTDLNNEDRDLINKIIGNRFKDNVKKEDKKYTEDKKENEEEII